MKKVLLTTDDRKLTESLDRLSTRLEDYNTILGAYNSMGLPELTRAEFVSMMNNPKELIFNKMTKGIDMTLGGLKVHPSKAIEILVKPDGYESLMSIIESGKNSEDFMHNLYAIDIIENEIVLSQVIIDKETESAKVYATTDEGKRIADFIQSVLGQYSSIFGESANPHRLKTMIDMFIIEPQFHGHGINKECSVDFKAIEPYANTYA